jgi:hypothetical protein
MIEAAWMASENSYLEIPLGCLLNNLEHLSVSKGVGVRKRIIQNHHLRLVFR